MWFRNTFAALLSLLAFSEKSRSDVNLPVKIISGKEYFQALEENRYRALYLDQNYIYILSHDDTINVYSYDYQYRETYNISGFKFISASSINNKIYLHLSKETPRSSNLWMTPNYIFKFETKFSLVYGGNFSISSFFLLDTRIYISEYEWTDRYCGEICLGPDSSSIVIVEQKNKQKLFPRSKIGIFDINSDEDGRVLFYGVDLSDLVNDGVGTSGIYEIINGEISEFPIYRPFLQGDRIFINCQKFAISNQYFFCSSVFLDTDLDRIIYYNYIYDKIEKANVGRFESLSNLVRNGDIIFVAKDGKIAKFQAGLNRITVTVH